MNLLKCSPVLLLVLSPAFVFSQIASPSGSLPAASGAVNASNSLGQLDQMARQTVTDLGRVRIEKWKADGNVKEQTRGNVDSVQKNLTVALPALMQQVQSNPSSVGATVKLYRNLNVVYDVLASIAESTGTFGAKDEYQALAVDVANLDTLRRNIADQLEQMASTQDSAYAQLLNQVRMQQQATAAAAASTPPKKVIVDENEPPKKPAKKKKAAPAAAPTQ